MQADEVTEPQSVAMIRNLMRVAFSTILYDRGIIDPSQFKPMWVGPIIVPTLSSESPGDDAKQLCEFMEQGAFRALNESFLALKTSVLMLRSLFALLMAMPPLPPVEDRYFLSLKLTYRDGTPSDYEPTGFVNSGGGLRFPTQPIRLGVGPIIRTKHSSIGLDLLAAETEGFEACELKCEHIGQQAHSGGWAMELAQLGPRVCRSDETKQDDQVLAEAKCAQPSSSPTSVLPEPELEHDEPMTEQEPEHTLEPESLADRLGLVRLE